MKTKTLAIAASLFTAAGAASAQSDPAGFSTVYNIGTVPPGSIFDITSADIPGVVATGTQVGEDTPPLGEALISPAFLNRDTLGPDSQLNLFDGGTILGFFLVGPLDGPRSNIEVNIFGGIVGRSFDVLGGTVNISGGSFGGSFVAFSGTTVNISGGSIGNEFRAQSGSEINLFGTSFFLDGDPITELELDEAFIITDRNVTLTGVLADGTAFDFDLDTRSSSGGDEFTTGAKLSITLVPTPASASLLGLGALAACRRRR